MRTALAAQLGYAKNSSQTKNFRDLEYDAFLKVTRSLKKLQLDPSPEFPKLAAALHVNERLWNVIGVQVADEDNALPKDLRARLFYMAEFVSVQTSKVLKSEATIDSLIDMNVAILRGLKGGA